MRIRLTTFIYFLFKLLVVFIFFDGIRSNLLYNNFISPIKELLLLCLFFLTVFSNKNKVKSKILNPVLILFFLYHTIIGILSFYTIITFNITGFTIFYKYYQFILIVVSFYYFEETTKVKYNTLFTFIVSTGVIFVIINTLLYFIELPILINTRPWWGRFSVGYPTMDVISLCYTFVLLLFFEKLEIKPIKRFFYTILIGIGIILQVAGTGFVLLFAIFSFALVFFIFKRKSVKILYRNIIYSLFSFLIAITLVYSILNSQYPLLIEKSLQVGNSKISILLGEETTLNTMEFRENQYNDAIQQQNSIFQKLFGIGFGMISLDLKSLYSKSNLIHIENQYALNLVSYGVFGATLFILWLLSIFWDILNIKNQSLITKSVYFLALFIFIANSKTLISLYLFSNMAFFALFYAVIRKYKNLNNT